MADKLLAEWFWADRWMGSSAFLLPLEARGLYREMLTQAWRRGAQLPNDHEAIRRAVGASMREWSKNWPKVDKFWIVRGEVLVNETQLLIYADAKARSERAQARAQAGAQARHKHLLKDCPPSPSPSQSLKEPPNPLSAKGGTRQRITRDDRKHAKTIRANRCGRCHHEPPCQDGQSCESAIAGELSARRAS